MALISTKMRGLLRVLLLPAAILGVAVENELCPADYAETKICSARQDFVLVLDRSYSRRNEFEEFKIFLKAFIDNIGLDGTNDGPQVSLVSFAGRVLKDDAVNEWNNAAGHALDTTYMPLSGDRGAVQTWINNLEEPPASCTETDGCTCISCGAEVAWARIPEAARQGAASALRARHCPPSLRALAAPSPRPRRTLAALLPRPRRASLCSLSLLVVLLGWHPTVSTGSLSLSLSERLPCTLCRAGRAQRSRSAADAHFLDRRRAE